MVKAKSKKKITETKMKPCPCPDHKGKKLPATLEYWHKGGNPDGLQGYCRQWRNKAQNAANKAARKAARRSGKRDAQKKVRRVTDRRTPNPPGKKTVTTIIVCNRCKEDHTPQNFQSNGKGGIRQPCKSCIAKMRTERKSKLIEVST